LLSLHQVAKSGFRCYGIAYPTAKAVIVLRADARYQADF
jgi:hypothetical protein